MQILVFGVRNGNRRHSSGIDKIATLMIKLVLVGLSSMVLAATAVSAHDSIIPQTYLMLVHSRHGGGFERVPMTDIEQCEIEGKKWVNAEIKGMDGRFRGYYCIQGAR